MWIGFDTETFLIVPGRIVPRMVCLTLAGQGDVPDVLRRADARFPMGARIQESQGAWAALLDNLTDNGRPVSAAVTVFQELLADPNVTLVAHNAPFDLAVLAEAMGDIAPIMRCLDENDLDDGRTGARIKDTAIREKLIAIATDRLGFDPRLGTVPKFNLAELVNAHFGVDITAGKASRTCKTCPTLKDFGPVPMDPCPECGTWRLVYHRLSATWAKAYPKAAADYAIEDAEWALRVALAQAAPQMSDVDRPIVHENGDVVNEDDQLRAAFALHLMAAHGVRVDDEAVERWGQELEEAAKQIDAAGRRAGFLRDNGTKDMKKLYALVEACYGQACPRTEKGTVKTDQETLAGSGDPNLILFADPDSVRKNLTTYMPILRAAKGTVLTSSPNVLVATGRTSWRNPNLQNPPRTGGFRGCFIPRPGNAFVSVDYSIIELRALAQIHLWWFKQSSMAEALWAGEDLHLSLGAQLEGVSYAEAQAILADKAHPDYARIKEARQTAKIANFGYPGGLSSETFVSYAAAYGVMLSPERAQQIKDAWFARWVEMEQYFDLIKSATAWGPATAVQAVSGRQRAGCTFTTMANSYFQGLPADGGKAALWALAKEGYTGTGPLRGVRPWVFIHDEVIAEGPLETLTEWADEMTKVMISAMQDYIPDIPILASPAAMLRWYKDAEEVRVDGKLVPWEPKKETT